MRFLWSVLLNCPQSLRKTSTALCIADSRSRHPAGRPSRSQRASQSPSLKFTPNGLPSASNTCTRPVVRVTQNARQLAAPSISASDADSTASSSTALVSPGPKAPGWPFRLGSCATGASCLGALQELHTPSAVEAFLWLHALQTHRFPSTSPRFGPLPCSMDNTLYLLEGLAGVTDRPFAAALALPLALLANKRPSTFMIPPASSAPLEASAPEAACAARALAASGSATSPAAASADANFASR
mmetsp:Transcript_146510/g.365356  ORF Transcript_146510/g.365356 Transcript_146510/m.365356 type:complete len:243 (-) Transcript_146510:1498-2226(-)